MKTKRPTNRLLPLLAAFALLGSAHAQTTAVPDYLSYQGRALNADGTAIGAGTPVNRTITFRVWDHPSNGLTANLIYSEQQVVTIANGEFSALIGAGAATTGTPLGYSESTKGVPTVKISTPSVFGAATRYLGVTIDDGTAAVDNEISPRQQFVTSSYAFRAKVAESVDANAISSAMLATGAVGSTQLAAASVTNAKLGTDAVLTTNIGNLNVTTAKIADLSVTTGKIADASVTGAKIADANVTGAKIADANVTTIKIADNAVDNTKLRDSSGLSVIGRTGNTTGDPADIVASIDGQVLRRSGNSVGFGTVGTAGIANDAITTAKIADTSVSLADLVASVQQALCPPGTITAYGGSTPPDGWLLCNGASYLSSTYPSLHQVIGTAYGSADVNSFNVPDFRGRFLRGWDNAIGRDPDRASRTAMATGGNAGDAIGSIQTDAIQSHTHTYDTPTTANRNGGTGATYTNRESAVNSTTGAVSAGARTSTETRPINAYVNYIIKF
jgi:microcystin-dependent protein